MEATRLIVKVIALTAVGLLAGCGGDSEQVFDEEGFPFEFTYPGDFEVSEDVSVDQALGAAPDETLAVGIDDDNGIILQRYSLAVEVDESNLGDAKAELDRLIGQVSPGTQGKEGETGGYPSLTYEPIAVPSIDGGESRFTFLFEGDQEYVINCQSTPEERETIDAACDKALSTLAPN